MATTPTSPTSTSASMPSWSSTSREHFTASELTQRTMLSDLMQQKALLIGLGLAIGVVVLLWRRPAPQARAARRLVRDWKHVDDPDDVRDLLGSTLPTIIRPALLMALAEIERQVEQGFRRLERDIQRL